MEKIVDLKFNQGGIRTHLPGISRANKRRLAEALRPAPDYSGELKAKFAADGVYIQSFQSFGTGILNSHTPTWTFVCPEK